MGCTSAYYSEVETDCPLVPLSRVAGQGHTGDTTYASAGVKDAGREVETVVEVHAEESLDVARIQLRETLRLCFPISAIGCVSFFEYHG